MKPFSEWLVLHNGARHIVHLEGETPLASVMGWNVVASLSCEMRDDGKRVDVMTLSCAKDGVEVRTRGYLVEGAPALEQHVPIEIIEGPARCEVVALAFASRPVT